MKKILITGCYGQLGKELANLAKLSPEYQFLMHDVDTLDLTKFDELHEFLLKEKPEIIINCAAYTAVDKAEADELTATLLNETVPGKLAEFATEISAVLLHVSTDYVFNGKTHKPYKEDDSTHPESVYGKTKEKGERLVLSHGDHFVVRTSWLYSAHGNNFLKTILRLSEERDELRIIFDQIGTPTYAGDLAAALMEMVQKIIKDKKASSAGIYHFSNEGVCSWYDFAKEIVEKTNATCQVLPIESHEYPLPAPRPFYSVLNKTKIKRNFKLQIPYWKDSMIKCIQELKFE